MIGKITMKKNQCGNIMTKKKCLCKYLQMKLKILSKIPRLEKKKEKLIKNLSPPKLNKERTALVSKNKKPPCI